MARILAVGIATIDIINLLDHYPAENDEVRVISQQQLRGGNATNTLVVLSQLGHQCDWAGVLVNEPDAAIVEQDLQAHGINFEHCYRPDHGKMPTSYISLNQQNGSRTIVHHRDCPEYDFEQFRQIDLTSYDWIHFEGRAVEELALMLDWLATHAAELPVSLEVEKPRDGIETLFDKADVLLFSQHYAQAKGFESAESLLNSLNIDGLQSCAWGAQGAWLKAQNQLIHQTAFPPEKMVDSLGAGDTFNAAFISALIENVTPQQALKQACQLAGKKCGQNGLNNIINHD